MKTWAAMMHTFGSIEVPFHRILLIFCRDPISHSLTEIGMTGWKILIFNRKFIDSNSRCSMIFEQGYNFLDVMSHWKQ